MAKRSTSIAETTSSDKHVGPVAEANLKTAALAVLFALPASPCVAQTASGEIEKSKQQFVQALNTGDAAMIARIYTERAIVLPAQGRHDPGTRSDPEYWAGVIAGGLRNLLLRSVRIDEYGGDAAREIGRFRIDPGTRPRETKPAGSRGSTWCCGARAAASGSTTPISGTLPTHRDPMCRPARLLRPPRSEREPLRRPGNRLARALKRRSDRCCRQQIPHPRPASTGGRNLPQTARRPNFRQCRNRQESGSSPYGCWSWLCLTALGGAGGWYWWQQQLNALPPGIAKTNGRLEAEQVEIATKYPGRIAVVLAKEGDMVHAGDVLARMDTAELEAQLQAAKAQVRRNESEKTMAEALIVRAHQRAALCATGVPADQHPQQAGMGADRKARRYFQQAEDRDRRS